MQIRIMQQENNLASPASLLKDSPPFLYRSLHLTRCQAYPPRTEVSVGQDSRGREMWRQVQWKERNWVVKRTVNSLFWKRRGCDSHVAEEPGLPHTDGAQKPWLAGQPGPAEINLGVFIQEMKGSWKGIVTLIGSNFSLNECGHFINFPPLPSE